MIIKILSLIKLSSLITCLLCCHRYLERLIMPAGVWGEKHTFRWPDGSPSWISWVTCTLSNPLSLLVKWEADSIGHEESTLRGLDKLYHKSAIIINWNTHGMFEWNSLKKVGAGEFFIKQSNLLLRGAICTKWKTFRLNICFVFLTLPLVTIKLSD